MSNHERDIQLKLRGMRYFWNMGYFVRKNIDLTKFKDNRDITITDIDILAIRFNEIFEKNVIICDCKTGFTAKNTERLLILGGLLKSLNADNAIFLRDIIDERDNIEFARKLGIHVLSSNQLEKLEESFGIDKSLFYGPFSTKTDKQVNIFAILKENRKEIHDYFLKKNWFETPNKRIMTIGRYSNFIKELPPNVFSQEEKAFLQGFALGLISIAILEFAKDLLYIKNEHKEEAIKQMLLGGSLQLYEKQELLSTFYDFMVKEISVKYHKYYDISKKSFLDQLVPEYVKYLYDLIKRICSNSKNAIHIPRIIDLIIYEKILLHNDPSFEHLHTLCISSKSEAIDLVRDLLTFSERSGFIDKFTKEQIEFGLISL